MKWIQINSRKSCTKGVCLVVFFFACSLVCSAQDELQIHTNGAIKMHAGSQLGVFGVLTNDGTFGGSNGNHGELYLAGTAQQIVQGDSVLQFDSIFLSNDSDVLVQLELRIAGHLEFDNGSFLTNRQDSNQAFIHFMDNTSYSGEGDAKHIDGTVRKTGNDAFVFPIGQYGNLQVLAISAPSQSDDHFTAFYKQQDPSLSGYSTTAIDSNCGGSPVVVDISEMEYWNLERTGGSSNVAVQLNYDTYSGVNTPSEIMIVNWDGSQWVSQGNGGNTGSSANGTITSGTGCGAVGSVSAVSAYGPFTLSASSLSALPVEYLFFQVEKYHESQSLLSWATASERDNSHFVVEKSTDGNHFIELGEVVGSGNSNQILQYRFIDFSPALGINYYRIKQVDYNGNFDYTEIKSLNFKSGSELVAYPNPARNHITLDLSGISMPWEGSSLQVFDHLGKLITVVAIPAETSTYTLNTGGWRAGLYILSIDNKNIRVIKQ